jgi:hypothetical protein
MRRILIALSVALVPTLAALSAAPAARADDVEERLRRLEADLARTRAELEALRREAALASPTAAPAPAPGPASPTAAPSPGTGTASRVPDPPEEEPLSGTGRWGPVEVKAGLGKGFTVGLLDDAFSVNVRGRVQVRFTHGVLEGNSDVPGGEDSYTSFQVRRARLVFQGHAIDRTLTYYIQLGFSNGDTERDIESPLRDAYLNWAPLRDVQLRLGQMKVPFSRQRVVSSSALQFPDRTNVQGELNLDRDVGVVVHSPDLGGMDGLLSYWAGVFGGEGRNHVGADPGVLVVGRFQLAPLGKFDDYVEVAFDRAGPPRLAMAASVAWNENSTRDRSTFNRVFTAAAADTVDYWHLEADLHFKWAGFSLLSEVHYRDAGEPTVAGFVGGRNVSEPTRSAWGLFGQAGYMLTRHVEVAGRHGETFPLGGLTAVAHTRETSGALSYYVFRHDLKVQGDWTYLWGERLSGGTHELRVQVQLFF